MKRNDMREQAFLLTFESLFCSECQPEELISLFSENIEPVSDYAENIFTGLKDKQEELDALINEHSTSWRAARLPKVTLAVLYVSLYEMLYVESVPESVAINEAVNLAKKYSYSEDASYINGVLGAVSRSR